MTWPGTEGRRWRWTLKIGGKVRYREDGKPLPMIALPVFGYKSHISIDRRYGFIRAGAVTSAAHADGRMLRCVIGENASSEVWADTAYRSRANEAWLADRMLTSRIHRRKPKRAWPQLESHRLNVLSRFLGIEHHHHDALSDARAASRRAPSPPSLCLDRAGQNAAGCDFR